MRRRPLPDLIAALAALFAAAAAVPPASAETPPVTPAQVVVLIDGSGSMWGGLGADGVAKIAGVRRALDAALPAIATRHPIGLVTFGPGCRSTEVAALPIAGPAANATEPLQRFNPRGKGPLVAGLETAAQTFPPGAEGHVILFHDGLDNCGQNACTVAEALHRSHPGLAVHTVSLGLEPAEQQAISCLSRTTGGRAMPVGDHAALDAAVTSLVALIGGSGPAAAPPSPAPASAPPPVAQPSGPPRLVASATLAAGKAPITMPLVWHVVDAKTGTVLAEAVAPTLGVAVPAGRVRVEAKAGKIGVTRDVEIAPSGDTRAELTLDAGIVRFETGARKLASDSEEPLIRLDRLADVTSAIAGKPSAEPRAPGSTPLWIARGTAAEAILPPGSYRAVAELGLARAEQRITVAAGSEASISLPLEAGRLELQLAAKQSGAVNYSIAIDDPSTPSGQRIVARSAHPTASFVLSTGSYAVTANIDGVDTRRVLAVRQGEVTRETFGDELGRLTVTATLNGGAFPAGQRPLLSLAALSQQASHAATPATSGRVMSLPAGRYRVTLKAAPGGPTASRDIDIAAGADARMTLDVAAAELAITGTARTSGGTAAICDLRIPGRGAGGGIVWRGVEADPRVVVAPGKYVLRCSAGLVQREQTVTLAAGGRVSMPAFGP